MGHASIPYVRYLFFTLIGIAYERTVIQGFFLERIRSNEPGIFGAQNLLLGISVFVLLCTAIGSSIIYFGRKSASSDWPFLRKIWFELTVLNFLLTTDIVSLGMSIWQGCLITVETPGGQLCRPLYFTWFSQLIIGMSIIAYATFLLCTHLERYIREQLELPDEVTLDDMRRELALWRKQNGV